MSRTDVSESASARVRSGCLAAARLAMAVLLAAGVGARGEERVSLQLKYYHQFQFAGYYAADYLGYYREAGLAVDIREFRPDLDVCAGVLAGRSDFAIVSTQLFTEWAEGHDLFLLAIIHQRNPHVLIVHADSPYRTLKDLLDLPREQLVCPVTRVGTEMWIGLRQLGRDPATFFGRMKEPEDLERFARHELPVYPGLITNELLRLRRRAIPVRTVEILPNSALVPGDSLVCSGALWRHRPELAKRFRAASLRGWEYAIAHQAEVIDHIIARRPSPDFPHDRTHLVEEAAANVELIDSDRFPLGEINGERLQRIARMLSDSGTPIEVHGDQFYQPPDPWRLWLALLGALLAAGAAGILALSLVARRQRVSLAESTTHYRNLVDIAQGYFAYRVTILRSGKPRLDVASPSICEVFGHSMAELQADPDLMLARMPEEERAQALAMRATMLKERATGHVRWRFRISDPRNPDGFRHLVSNISHMPTAEGFCLDGVTIDITAEVEAEARQRQLQEQLGRAQSNESLGLLASGIAHDFNNILSAIRGNAELVSPLLPASGRPRIERLFQAVDRASGLVRQILAYAGRGRVEIRPLDLGEELKQIDALLRHAMPEQVTTRIAIAPGLPAVLFDPSQFQQVLVNLLMNAGESYDGQPGEVLSRLDLHEGMVRLRVSDQGCGMDDATLQRIFEPYFTTKSHGHGLGLAAVQGIMRSAQGSIACESRPGQGTTFTLRFVAGPQAAVALPAPATATHALDDERAVLVVDDDPLVREIAVASLEALGYRCREAADGRTCLALLGSERQRINAVLLDCRMPDLDGIAVLKDLRSRGDRIPVVLMSGMLIREGIGTDVIDRRTRFLAKPFSQAQLATAIEGLFGSRGRGGKDDSSRTAIAVVDIIRQRHESEARNRPPGPPAADQPR
jgi:two-component system cell cycle sensor histidine kinase/response regulator CckA